MSIRSFLGIEEKTKETDPVLPEGTQNAAADAQCSENAAEAPSENSVPIETTYNEEKTEKAPDRGRFMTDETYVPEPEHEFEEPEVPEEGDSPAHRVRQMLGLKDPEPEPEGKYAMLHPWNLVISWILLYIPVIGLIIAGAWALGLTFRRQKKYLGRARLILWLIGMVAACLFSFVYFVVMRYTIDDIPLLIEYVHELFIGFLSRLLNLPL